jgi:hypothetical protein
MPAAMHIQSMARLHMPVSQVQSMMMCPKLSYLSNMRHIKKLPQISCGTYAWYWFWQHLKRSVSICKFQQALSVVVLPKNSTG